MKKIIYRCNQKFKIKTTFMKIVKCINDKYYYQLYKNEIYYVYKEKINYYVICINKCYYCFIKSCFIDITRELKLKKLL